MNKKIPFPIAIIIIAALAILVGGVVVWQYSRMPEIKVLRKTQLEDETADWKTYRNEEYGFEIKYPDGWTLNLNPTVIIFGHPAIGKVVFTFILSVFENANTEQLSSKQWVEKMVINVPRGYTYKDEYEVTIADLPAYELNRVFAVDQNEERIYLSKDSYIFEFSFPVAEENPNLTNPVENNRIIHKMLSTFKFTK